MIVKLQYQKQVITQETPNTFQEKYVKLDTTPMVQPQQQAAQSVPLEVIAQMQQMQILKEHAQKHNALAEQNALKEVPKK